jgi:HEAT repeat protein
LLFVIILTQQYSFYTVIRSAFPDAKHLAGFLGYFNGTSMAVTFLLQITLSGAVIKKIGSTRAMFLLPSALFLVFSAIASLNWLPVSHTATLASRAILYGIVAGVGIRIAFFDSFFSPNFQLFFSSLPQELRGRGKLALEGAVKPFAIAVTSGWLVWGASRLSLTVNALISAIISAGMIYQVFRIKRSYTASLSRYLNKFKLGASSSFLELLGLSHTEDLFSSLSTMLEKESFEIKICLIEILAGIGTDEALSVMADHLKRADDMSKAAILTALGRTKNPVWKSTIIQLLADKSLRVVASAVSTLGEYNDAEIDEGLQIFLMHTDHRIRGNATVALWQHADAYKRKSLEKVLEDMLKNEDVRQKASAIYALGQISKNGQTHPMLSVFCNESSTSIFKEDRLWHQVCAALSNCGDETACSILLGYSIQVPRRRLADICKALAAIIRNGYAVVSIIKHISTAPGSVRNLIFKAVLSANAEGEMRSLAGHEALLWAESEYLSLQEAKKMHAALKKAVSHETITLLADAVREEYMDIHRQNLEMLAALLDSSGEVKKTIRCLASTHKHVRARALEVLDNVGNARINKWVILLAEENSVESYNSTDGHRTEKLQEMSLNDSIDYCFLQGTPWIRECAAFVRQSIPEARA